MTMNYKNKWQLLLAITTILVSCTQPPARLDLMDEGHIEDGLARLQQAARKHPNNLDRRTDFIRERERAVDYLLLLGDRMREQGRADEATVYFQRVLAIEPGNTHAKEGMDAIARSKREEQIMVAARALFGKGDLEGAQNKLQAIFKENPTHAEALSLRREIEDTRARNNQMMMPTLKSKFKQPISLQFRDANLKMVFEVISRTSGINILLDRDLRSDLKTSIFVKDTSVEDAIDLILMQNQLDKKVLNDSTVFIYPDTPAKRKEYQDLVIRTFHFTNADAKQMETMIKTMLGTKELFVHEKTNSLVMRDTPQAVKLAEKLVASQDINDPEVMLEVEVMEVLHSKLTQLGVKWPNQLGLLVTSTPATSTSTTTSGGAVVTTNTPSTPLTVNGLKQINGNAIQVSPLSMTLDLRKELGDSNLLASPRIRVKQHEKAKIMIGDRVPVITNSVTPVSTGTPVVTGNVQYLDVGLKLEVEPDIHMDGEVAIKTYLEVSTIANQVTNASSGTVAYQIGTRNVSTVLRLKDGETQVLAGLINDEDRKSVASVPGLGDLPIIGHLFASHGDDKRKTEIILSITPHIIRNNHRPDADLAEFWSGTQDSLSDKPLTLEAVGKVSNQLAAGPTPYLQSASPSLPTVTTPLPPVGIAAATQRPLPSEVVPGKLLPGIKPPIAPLLISWQGASRAKVGDQFKVTVYAQAASRFVSLPFKVDYDSSALEVVAVSKGELFTGKNSQAVFKSDVDQPGGEVSVDISEPPGQEGIGGRGSLAVLTFRVTAANPEVPITVTGSAVNAAGDEVPVTLPSPHNVALLP